MARATADVRVTIHRPRTEVFAMLADYARLPEWQPGVSACRMDGPARVGAKVFQTRTVMGREIESTSEMTAFEQDRKLRMRSENRLFTYEGGYDLADEGADGDATVVHYRGEITTGGMLAFLGKRAAGMFQDKMIEDLARLKAMMEGA